ncbi:hypothetical protein BDV23DRAFT_188131 [Aspergillus alliaceus]|uniref:BTB domain-containing protein n=1 Tax=Petromyces alliaceus TaxID=209559 RepID=A0A5N7BUM1_PETAA|nr:hypothetical protein BDV23DRAFT_188131 [Aspergillus alliaceus]
MSSTCTNQSTPLPSSPEDTDTTIITLQVRDKSIPTTHYTLTHKSPYFKALLSEQWNSALPDGSYFIDADPKIFKHVLEYLSRGTLPLFYDRVNGHDYGKYHALLSQASYFGISELETWLWEQRYLQAVSVETKVKLREGSVAKNYASTGSSDVVEEVYPQWGCRRSWVCPRGIMVHDGKPEACGIKCKKVGCGDSYEEVPDLLGVMVVQKKVVFDRTKCV